MINAFRKYSRTLKRRATRFKKYSDLRAPIGAARRRICFAINKLETDVHAGQGRRASLAHMILRNVDGLALESERAQALAIALRHFDTDPDCMGPLQNAFREKFAANTTNVSPKAMAMVITSPSPSIFGMAWRTFYHKPPVVRNDASAYSLMKLRRPVHQKLLREGPGF